MTITSAENIQFTYAVDPMAVAAFFVRADQLRDESDLTPMKLQKLLYLAQANYLASTGERLFDASVEAFEHGPVVYSVWREFNGRQIIEVEDHSDVARLAVTADVEEFLERVWAKYRDWSASSLRRLTHEQDPWRDHFIPEQLHTTIPDDAMTSYFRRSVSANERVFHQNVVLVTPDVYGDDDEADARLQSFLTA